VREAVGEGVEQVHLAVQPVAAGAAGLLVVRLERARHRVVHDEPDVRLVDAHAERVGRYDGPHLLVHERVLHLVPVRVVEPAWYATTGSLARVSTPVTRSTDLRVAA
jgi:hypothetical protein